MAQKRMFDKAIIDTDKFIDLPLSSKAIYFLLGMEADDEGFVSPKKVARIHGSSDDDIKLLIAKEFIIPFQSGVVVITNWHQNNWLDSRRSLPTQYQIEKKQLHLTRTRKYVLSTGSANAQPMLSDGSASTEESRREEKMSEAERVETRKKLADMRQSLFG